MDITTNMNVFEKELYEKGRKSQSKYTSYDEFFEHVKTDFGTEYGAFYILGYIQANGMDFLVKEE